jgi:prolyl-tRNA synthetase
MRLSQLFTRTLKEAPSDETAVNAKLLIRGGFVYKNSAGVYSFLPLGLRVIRKISDIVRDEMNALGAQELLMSALHEKHYLKATGRWDVDVVYKVIAGDEKDPNFNISWTHEEVMSEIATKYVNSYRDLPFASYQIQTKFRHEPRAKSGLLRGREFLMKDLYSFHRDAADLDAYYDKVRDAYLKIFERCGVKAIYTLAAGGDFTTNLTHEFQVVCPIGEDTIYVCSQCGYAENKEISSLKDGDACQKCGGAVTEEKAVEVGNIFRYGTKYSEPFGLKFSDEESKQHHVVTGAYGIGISRLMATLVEVSHDDSGMIWPRGVAPFQVHLVSIGQNERAEKIYQMLTDAKIEVLYDDREQQSAGEKFADADLIGCPIRITIGKKTPEGQVECKRRNESDMRLVADSDIQALVVG